LFITRGDANDQVPFWWRDGKRFSSSQSRNGRNEVSLCARAARTLGASRRPIPMNRIAASPPDDAKIAFVPTATGRRTSTS
jgi:hypothetical protein